MKRLLVFVVIAITAGGCSERGRSSGLIVGTGVVYQLGGECGDAWLVQADSGREYELTDLPTEFQHTDLRVRFTLKQRDDLASVCMVGPITDVVSMRRL